MNIFITDKNIDKIAENYADQHIWTSLNEIPLMLACAYHLEVLLSQEVGNRTFREATLQSSIKNDPCSLWVRQSKENYQFAIELWYKLEFQSILRFDAGRHRYLKFIHWCKHNLPNNFISTGLTLFPGFFNQNSEAKKMQEKGVDDIIALYRLYYKEKKHLTWKKEKPAWLN